MSVRPDSGPRSQPASALSHLRPDGSAHMVDVSDREVAVRTAVARGRVRTSAGPLIAEGALPKGDALAVARIAGIMAAKRTPDLVPLCHPIALHRVEVEVEADGDGVRLEARVTTADRTGVEMEALTAVAVAGLAVIDMVKAIDPDAALAEVRVESKDGGRSGPWRRGQA